MIRGWVLATVLGSLSAGEPAPPVTIVPAGHPAAEVVALAGAMLAPDALDRGLGFRPVVLAALRAPPATAWQALAHALDLEWVPAESGGAWLTTADRLPAGQRRGRTWPGAGARPLTLERQIQDLMAPWLGGGAAIALDPLSGSWSATLDATGLARVEDILTALEDDGARLPPLIRPAAPEGRHRDLPSSDWSSFAADLVEAGAPAVAIHPSLLSASAPAVPAGPLATLPDRLGIPAAWIDGCLCIGQPRSRLHPAWAARVAVIPVGHLRRPAVELATGVASAIPRRPGWGVVAHPGGTALIVIADPAAIHGVLDLLDQWERDGALLAP